jgi:hypothetical protein
MTNKKMLWTIGLLASVALLPHASSTLLGGDPNNNCNNYGFVVQAGVNNTYSCTVNVYVCDQGSGSGAGAGAGSGAGGSDAGAEATAGNSCKDPSGAGAETRSGVVRVPLPSSTWIVYEVKQLITP